MRRLLAISATALLIQAAPAGAQLVVFGGGDAVTAVSQHVVPIEVSGSVVVRYGGDRAGGCEAAGLCDVSGTIVWDPGSSGEINLLEYKNSKGTRRVVATALFEPGLNGTSLTTTVRRRAADGSGHTCIDARRESVYASSDAVDVGDSLKLGLTTREGAAIDLGRTRCAGPTTDDLLSTLPVAEVAVKTLRAGGSTLDLGSDKPFSAGGLTGSVRSTLRLQLAKGIRRGAVNPTGSRGVRTVTAEYKIESITGTLATRFAAAGDPFPCGALDACGVTGTLTASPTVKQGEVYMTTYSRRSVRDMRAALGLSARGRAKGIPVYGYGTWTDKGSAAAEVNRPDGPTCRSQAPLAPGYLEIQPTSKRVNVRWVGAVPRTRCPGPSSQDVAANTYVATGSVPRSAFRSKRIVIRLAKGASFSGDGYAGKTSPDVVFTLERESVKVRKAF